MGAGDVARPGASGRYWPALDGVRALAVGAVIAFHLGVLGGGWIGVDVFFVLSGFLITTLLLDERDRTGTVRLGAFWARRARRLLPALGLMLVALALYAALGGTAVVPAQLRSPALATLLYVANWQQLIAGHGYFAHFDMVSPLQHTWSLAIEEQYYLVWPLLFLLLARLARGRSRRALVTPMVVLAVASAAWMGVAAGLVGPNRAYLGTDTRAWELLLGGVGAVLARAPAARRRPRAWTVAGTVGLIALVVGAAMASGPPRWIWDGGLVVLAGAALVVVMGAVGHPTGAVARLLGLAPLRVVGRLSYSLYLWHWPVIVVMTEQTTGLGGTALLVCRLATMFAAAAVSYVAVERPLRRADWSVWRRRALVPVGLAAVLGALVAATVPPVEASTAAVRVPTIVAQRVRATSSAPATTTTTVPTPLPAGRVATPSDPLRAWIMGDSVMDDSEPGVTAALQATGDVQVVVNSAFGGWGLSTDTSFSADFARIIAQYHPEVVIGTWSWDDLLATENPQSYLDTLVRALHDILTPGDGVDLVVLLQFPQVGPSPEILDPTLQYQQWEASNTEQDAWNDVARQAVGFFPDHAMYLPTDQLFAPGGRFFTWMRTPSGAWLRARKIDSVHMCPYGAAEFGALLVSDLTPVLHLSPMAPGWELGDWVRDANFNDPPGACPADQPPPGYAGIPVPGPPS